MARLGAEFKGNVAILYKVDDAELNPTRQWIIQFRIRKDFKSLHIET